METPKINRISLMHLPFGQPNTHEVMVNTTNFDKTRHRIVIQLNTKVFELNINTLSLIIPPNKKSNTTLTTLMPPSNDLRIKGYIYDYIDDKIVEAKSQEYSYNSFLNTYTPYETLQNTLPVITGLWKKDKKVIQVEGPFGTDGKLATTLTLGVPYTYKATPNQSLLSIDLLSIKWSYKYDNGEKTLFKHQQETTKGNQNLITCTFPKNSKANNITVYAYFNEPSDRVSVKTEVFVKEVIFNDISTNEIIFPLLVKPENDKDGKWKSYYWAAEEGSNQATFNSYRQKRTRKHAARDLYTLPETTVVSITNGVVLEVKPFYAQTDQVTILHETNDGRKFIIRYGELAPNSISVKKGNTVKQKQKLGVTGKLVGITVIKGQNVYMNHFEYFNGNEGFDLKIPLSSNNKPFMRRSDLVDSINILQEGYKNTFEVNLKNTKDERVDPKLLSLSEKGKKFIKDWEVFKTIAYNDSEGYCTIGYGNLIAYDKCENIEISDEFKKGITKEKASELFELKLVTFESSVKRDITSKLYQYEYDALVSLVFNTGPNFLNTGGVKKGETKIKKKINNGEYEAGADEMADVTNNGTLGLIKRRKAEINIFKNNVYNSQH